MRAEQSPDLDGLWALWETGRTPVHCTEGEVLPTSMCLSLLASPGLDWPLSRACLRRKAHHHPVCHEQDQSGCDVDGKEGAWGSLEVLPLTAAEQVLLP